MLVNVTWRCNEGCTHCLVDATPDGPDMRKETWGQVRDFIEQVQPRVVMLSGGEPTLHPKLLPWAEQLIERGIVVLIASNGSFVEDEAKTKKLLDFLREHIEQCTLQVTADLRFYPNALARLPKLRALGLLVEDHIREVIPAGRALENHPEAGRTTLSPKCANMYLTAKQLAQQTGAVSMADMLRTMEHHQKVCTPLITPHGDILAGEMRMCHRLGHVSDRFQAEPLIRLLTGRPCNACGMMRNVAPRHREILMS